MKLLKTIPYGTRDYLPADAVLKTEIESKLVKTFSSWGYDPVITPTLEFIDTFNAGNGKFLDERMFKFFDRYENREVVLRYEMTTPIARLVATRLKNSPMPIKLFYLANIFRYEQTQAGRQCEFFQAGAELMGQGSIAADAEIIALAVKSIETAGLKNFSICLGQVEFVRGLMQEFGITHQTQRAIERSIESHDLVALDSIVDSLHLQKSQAEALKEIPSLHGKNLDRAYEFAGNEKSRRALDDLRKIKELLANYEADDRIIFDLGLIRDFGYYTGMVFEAYTPELGMSIAGGGRYDRLLFDFGLASPATGFALGIDRVMLALKNSVEKFSTAEKIYVSYASDKISDAIKLAMKLRSEGKNVELSLTAQTREAAEKFRGKKNFSELIYVD